MLTSQFLVATLKETPADAELVSHQLMLRAGLIRRVASGIYSWLPLGQRVLNKVIAIIREEMNQVGALEMLMPAVQPAELWQESGRLHQYGSELLRFNDRHDREFCFGPTHEEVISDIGRNTLKSYKQLPIVFYQIQVKFRDEIRPRFGVMRGREFLMKDAYSFAITDADMQQCYQNMYRAYENIFQRLGLTYRAVLADTGSIGGHYSHEFQVLAESGEDVIVASDGSDYAANIEKASAQQLVAERPAPTESMNKISTPGVKTIAALAEQFQLLPEHGVKTLIVHGVEDPLVALIIRGDHCLNPLKAEKLANVASPLSMASETEIRQAIGCGLGSIGPVNLPIPYYVDRDAAQLSDFTCGANEDDFHLTHVNWERDAALTDVVDCRFVESGDPSPDGHGKLYFSRGIEVGHIFQLGTKYSSAMDVTVLDQQGKAVPLQMGCYGLGVSRVVAAAIEQHHDKNGIVWPASIAPFALAIIPLNMHKSPRVREVAERIYRELQQAGYEVLLDDRKERAGVMFADMDLMGIPHRLVIGERGLADGHVEYKARAGDAVEQLELDNLLTELTSKLLEKQRKSTVAQNS